MVFPPCGNFTQRDLYFVTLGPWNPTYAKEQRSCHADAYNQVLTSVYGKNFKEMKCSFEISEEGYHHIHFIIELRTPCRWKAANNALKKYHKTLDRHPDETRLMTCRFFYCIERDPKPIMLKYLCNPSKEKEVGEMFEPEPTKLLKDPSYYILWQTVKSLYFDQTDSAGEHWLACVLAYPPIPCLLAKRREF